MKSLIFLSALVLVAAAAIAGNRILAVLLAGYPVDPRWLVLAIVVIPPVYFLPAVLAASKNHPQAAAIFFVNLVLGWTIVGWVVALVWGAAGAPGEQKAYRPLFPVPRRAVTEPSPTPEAVTLALEALMDQRFRGQITEAEYLTGRQVILDQWKHVPAVAG